MIKQKRLKDIARVILPKLSEVHTTSRRNALPVVNMQFLRTGLADRYATDGILVEDGDILVVMDGYNAGEVLFAKKGYLGNSLSLIKPKKDIDSHYLFLCLKKQENTIRHFSKSDYINHLAVNVLAKIIINIPDYEEQVTIKNKQFSNFQNFEVAKEKTQEMRLQVNNLLKQKIKELLDNEKIYRIKDLVKTETGVTPKEATQESFNAIPFVSAKNIKNKEHPVNVNSYVPRLSYSKRCQRGDVLMTCVGSDIGNACVADKEYAFSQNLIKIFGAKEPTLKLIYYYVLTHNLDVFQKSAAISFLSSQSFKNIKISLPELSKRNEVLDEINHLFKKKELIDKELEKIENLLYESKASLIYETIE